MECFDFCKIDPAGLAAMVNAIASMLAKGKTADEVEMQAVLFDLLSDTLKSIACIKKHQTKLCKSKQDDTLKPDNAQ